MKRSCPCRSARAAGSQTLLPGGQKLVARIPSRRGAHVGRFGSERQSELRHLFEAGKIPIVSILIGRLVVALFIEFAEDLRPKAGGLTGELIAFRDRKRGDAGAREREVIGAIEAALLRTRVRLNGQSESLGRVLNQRP